MLLELRRNSWVIWSVILTRFVTYSLTHQFHILNYFLAEFQPYLLVVGRYDLSNLFLILVDSPPFVVNRWLSVRFNLLSSVVIGITGLVCLVTPSISASTAGFALAFASMITGNLLYLVCFKWRWLWTIFKIELLLGYRICRTWTIHGMTFPLDRLGVSYLRLGRLRTCQRILRNRSWAAGDYWAEALSLMAIQWSDQMRGSCHSLRCRSSTAIFV